MPLNQLAFPFECLVLAFEKSTDFRSARKTGVPSRLGPRPKANSSGESRISLQNAAWLNFIVLLALFYGNCVIFSVDLWCKEIRSLKDTGEPRSLAIRTSFVLQL